MEYAHTTNGPPSEWESLASHLTGVARRATEFAGVFDCAGWGFIAGLWHDLGKYSTAFQQYIRQRGDPHIAETSGVGGGRVDHSTAGARHACAQGHAGRLLAYCIAGHHAGLPDWEDGRSGLRFRLREKNVEPLRDVPTDLLERPVPAMPPFSWERGARGVAFQVSFFTRMLFSCLVDADFLETERFMSPDRAALRPRDPASIGDLLASLDAYLAELGEGAPDTAVNAKRREVLTACRTKAKHPLGLFSLTVPTGGGKTFSSLAFALAHAHHHGLHRIVYAAPFTSIIEQTAECFRTALTDRRDAVLEHHSNIDPEDPARHTARSRLAAENWDAPLIVTTNVQLFESLFASRPSRCRKLHRLARSVIVLDEAQTLPPNLLAPTLRAIEELARNYGTTVVLCTATQPAVERRDAFPIGLEGVTPIIGDPIALHNALRRTRVEVVARMDDDALASRLCHERQVLCIVNSRRHAADLFGRLREHCGDDGCLHLSAAMCAAHRSKVVAEIRDRLNPEASRPCRVISTQVIEAGVDVDFPAVFRAAAGLDSIAQAAGRCNREGRRREGLVTVFEYDDRAHRPPPFIRQATDSAREVIPDYADDLLSPRAIEAYFRRHYWQHGKDDGRGWDEPRGEGGGSVLGCFGAKGLECQFREAAALYRLIDDAQTPVLVPWGKGGEALRRELEDMPDPPDPAWLRSWDRRAQRFVVGVFERDLHALIENTVVLERHERFYVANSKAYDDDLGLTFDAAGLDPEDLVG